jgi:hypothetical protein
MDPQGRALGPATLDIRKPLAGGFPISSTKLVMSLVQKIEPTHAHTFAHTFELSDR